ncbi:MAG TPA: hypothetical protein EYO58_06835 [Flavobacteriales bacterium]|nr:hypothetical protein [Flavobacteriales bacterium]HIO16329.1 hypothetical protein [Flavobacteriales bacterium]
MLLEITAGPSVTELLVMLNVVIIIVAIVLWRKLVPKHLRSRLERFSMVRKAWLLMDTDQEQVAFTHLMIQAVKSDGMVRAEEMDKLIDEITQEIKVEASHMEDEIMWKIMEGFDRERKDNIYSAIEEVLRSDGLMSADELIWYASVVKKLN